MKKILVGFIMALCFIQMSNVVSAQNTELNIDEVTFPDENFRKYISYYFDTDDNDKLSQEEIESVTELIIKCGSNKIENDYMGETNSKIEDITGIEVFSNLERVNVSYSHIKFADFSGNPNLKTVSFDSEDLLSIDVTKNYAVTNFNITSPIIEKIDVTKNVKLKNFSIHCEKLHNIDISKNTELVKLHISSPLTSLDLSNNTKLGVLEFDDLQIKSLSLDSQKDLYYLIIFGNCRLQQLDLSAVKRMSYIILNRNLAVLNIGNNVIDRMEDITSSVDIEVSGNTFDLKQYFSMMDMSRVSNFKGATLNGSKVSSFDENTPITYDYNCGKSSDRDVTLSVTLNVKKVELPVEKLFVDVNAKYWYAPIVKEAYEAGLMTGTDETHFSPDKPMSRGMVATVLYRMAGKPKVEYTNKFNDVKDGLWYSEAIIWAANNKIVSGYDNGNFGPDDNITREQMAVMLCNYARYKKMNVNSNTDLSKFKDYKQVSSFAVPSMQWAVSKGIISGAENGTKLNPINNATRAECAKMLLEVSKLK